MLGGNSRFLARAFVLGDALRERDLFAHGFIEPAVGVESEALHYVKYLLANDLAGIPTHY